MFNSCGQRVLTFPVAVPIAAAVSIFLVLISGKQTFARRLNRGKCILSHKAGQEGHKGDGIRAQFNIFGTAPPWVRASIPAPENRKIAIAAAIPSPTFTNRRLKVRSAELVEE